MGQTNIRSKLVMDGGRVSIPVAEATALAAGIFEAAGCDAATARLVADHLADADLSGVESHGLMRTLQYTEQFEDGYMRAGASPRLVTNSRGAEEMDGGGGIGIPALSLAVDHCAAEARRSGMAALPVRNVGHTGRLGAFAEAGAAQGCLIIIIGGGARDRWRMVTPYGGRRATLPTNPLCMSMPGGERGPVVLDFATSMIAGGWLYAARRAGASLPEGLIVDVDGKPTQNPEDYFNGGAILPAGGAKGYALAVMAEMICEAMLGPVNTEVNWLVMALDTGRYRAADEMQAVAEEILADLRDCPPAPGFDRVEVPGERERDQRAANAAAGVSLPENTWNQIVALGTRLGVA